MSTARAFVQKHTAQAFFGSLVLALGLSALPLGAADTDYDCTPKVFTTQTGGPGNGSPVTVTWYDNAPLGLSACHYSDPTLPGGATKAQQYYAAVATHLYDENLCGACAEITKNANGNKVTVMITDECPAASNPTHCSSGSAHLDISQKAFTDLDGSLVSGVVNVSWKVVPCPLNFLNTRGQNGANLTYQFKSGASSGWATLIIKDYIMPIRSIDYCTGPGTGCSAATWQRPYNGWVPSGSWGSNFYIRVTDKSGNVGNFGPINCCTPQGTDSKTDPVTVFANFPAGQMPACGPVSTSTNTPTPSRTPTVCACSPTSTPTPTPAPADCPLVLNTCDSLTANGTWSGTSATRSIGSFTGMTGAGAMQVQVTTAAAYNNAIANLSGFAPADLSSYKRLTCDVFVPSSGMPWSGGAYHQLSLRGTHSTGATPYQYEVAMGSVSDLPIDGTASPNVVAVPSAGGTIYKLTYPLSFPGVTLMSAASATQVDTLFFVLNLAGQTTGTFYIDNIVLHTDAVCPPATATPTVTRTMTPTFTRTSTPVATFTSTVTPTRTSTGTPSNTSTLTNSPTSSNTPLPATSTPTRTATSTASSSVTPSSTRTVTLTATPSNTAIPATFTSTITGTSTATPSRTATLTSTSTASPTFSRTITVTSTQTNTPLPGATFTDTSTVSPTFSPTFTRTSTSTNTAVVPTSTSTSTVTLTFSRTATPTYSSTVVLPTSTSTNTPLPGSTFTDTSTISPTFSSTRTITPSITVTSTPSNTVVVPTSTSTNTPLPGSTFTDTSTVTPLSTATSSITPTATYSQTVVVPSSTSTNTPLPGSTFTDTSTVTPLSTATPSITVTATRTYTPLPGSTFTSTVTPLAGGAPGEGSVSVSPNQATQGAGGLSFTFTYTAVNAWSNGTLTIDVPGGWTLPNNAAGQPGAIIASTGSGNIGSLNASGSTITLGGVNLSAGGTLTVTYGWLGSSGPGVTAPNSAGFYNFIVRSDPTGSAVANLSANPQVELKAPTATLTTTVGSDGPNEIEKHSAFPSPWDGNSPLYVACKLSGHVDRLVLKVYTRSLVCVGSTELGAQNAGWTKIAAPKDFMLSAANGGYFYIVTAERDGQKNITKAIGKLQILR